MESQVQQAGGFVQLVVSWSGARLQVAQLPSFLIHCTVLAGFDERSGYRRGPFFIQWLGFCSLLVVTAMLEAGTAAAVGTGFR